MTDENQADARVFLSYSSQDAAVAQALCAALEGAGQRCWIAPRDVRAGEAYAAAIVPQAINSCRMLVLLLSRSAIDSPHVLREVERASSKKRPVLAVRLDTCELPPELEYLLSANFPVARRLQRRAGSGPPGPDRVGARSRSRCGRGGGCEAGAGSGSNCCGEPVRIRPRCARDAGSPFLLVAPRVLAYLPLSTRSGCPGS